MLVIAPDDIFTATEAADHLRKTPRQVQRYLKAGLLAGNRPNGHWQITGLALWRFTGIEEEMVKIWLQHCRAAPELSETPKA